MNIVLDLISASMLLGGAFFVLVGGIGIFRLPDFYTRLHGAGVTDTLGAGLILLGLTLQAGFTLATVKLLMILVFLFVTSPTSCHALAQAARANGLKPEGIVADPNPSND
jgi:multicomponent Na+:H+ antiporter subunit G